MAAVPPSRSREVPPEPDPSLKIHSQDVTEGPRRAAARAMLRAVGMTDDDFGRPQVGIASTWNEVTPCNLPLKRLANRAKQGVRDGGGFPLEFVTIAVSDGIAMGHEGMRASLVSREVIADSVETMMRAERFDAFVGLAGCDKSLPGMLMAAARLDLPMVFVYAGSILPGHWRDRTLDITSVFEAVGAHARGDIDDETLHGIEAHACPTEGACAGMFTANTMASVAEALGMALPASATPPAVDRRRDDIAYESGRVVVTLLEKRIRPRQIMTKGAFENAIAVTMALGGSTNAVLHLLAIANEARVELSIDDFNLIGGRVPHLADMKPHGKLPHGRSRPDRRRARRDAAPPRGGPPQRGLPHGDRRDRGGEPRPSAASRAGRRGRARLRLADPPPWHRRAARDPRARGRRREGRGGRHRPVRGRSPGLRRRGRGDGGDPRRFDRARNRPRHPLRRAQGRARDAGDALDHGRAGRGGPRSRTARSSPTAASPAGTQGFCIGHVAPEAVVGGPIALVADGDRVVIDAVAGSVDLDVDAGELARRRGRVEPADRPLHGRRAREVRASRHGRGARRGHGTLSSSPDGGLPFPGRF